ncbi:MAG: hypothetical protein WBW88_18540 [Rhodothermales bacterium]
MLPVALAVLSVWIVLPVRAQNLQPVTPPAQRGKIDAEREGTHDANRIRTKFLNFGMVGDYMTNPDLSVFHSVEVPRGTGLNYSDGITPFVLAHITQENGRDAYIMETGYRERQGRSPITDQVMRFEPRFGYFQRDPNINKGRSIAISNDPRTWPGATDETGAIRPASDPSECWLDKADDPDDPGWCGSWNGFFGKRPNADQESFSVMDDQYYDAWNFFPDSRDRTRRGLGLRVEVRGFQWANPQAQNVIFWHYDIVNEGTTDYDDNIIFGLYMDSGVGGAAVSCDGIAESDDDNAFYLTDFGEDLVYTWDKGGHGVSLSSNCAKTGYLGYAYLETPGNSFNGKDDDQDGIVDERRDGGPGEMIVGQDAIRDAVMSRYNLEDFERELGPLTERPAYVAGIWWTGDEDLDWVAEFHDTGADGVFADPNKGQTPDTGEGDGMPTEGEPNFDRTDINESDQIGLTGFKMNRIRAGAGAPSTETDNIVFFTNANDWPSRLFEQFSNPDPEVSFDAPLVLNYNIGFLFASGPFELKAGARERFSLALAWGGDLNELRDNVDVVSKIYDANYQFATPPPTPTLKAYAGDGFVKLAWDNASEKGIDPVSNRNDFEGYKIYRSTDPNFLDAQVITNARGTGPFGIGRPIQQYDLDNGISGFSDITVQGVAFYLGGDTGIAHTYVDSTVTNGQDYYYAVTSYDNGSGKFGFFPSENSASVSRTPRGGTILPQNVVEVRPNPRVPGFVDASVDLESLQHTAGGGYGSISARVVVPELVPDGHTFEITFKGFADSVRAETYEMADATTGGLLFDLGRDLAGEGSGPVGLGVLPVISTPQTVLIDTTSSGFVPGSTTDAVFKAQYSDALPINQRRPGFPENILITFADQPLDTSQAAIGAPATPARFRIDSEESGRRYNFRFRDVDGDHTLSKFGEFIDVVAPIAEGTSTERPVWRLQVDTSVVAQPASPPGQGDAYRLVVLRPYSPEDVFRFTVVGEHLDPEKEKSEFDAQEPYVVPNPYVASASFEPERFAVSGRGERRLEFRAIPVDATIRIYNLRGELVRELHQDGQLTGIVPWDLRSKDNLEVAPGLYIFHVDAGELGEHVGKFAIIK